MARNHGHDYSTFLLILRVIDALSLCNMTSNVKVKLIILCDRRCKSQNLRMLQLVVYNLSQLLVAKQSSLKY